MINLFKSLFWKIFLTVWVVSTAVVLSSAYSISYLSDQEAFEKQFQNDIKELVTPLLNQFNGKRNEPFPAPTIPIRISDSQGHILTGETYGTFKNPIRIPIKNKRDELFLIETNIPKSKERTVTAHFRHINVTATLIIMALASGILTIALVRPIRQLQSFSERLGHGEFNSRLDQKLTKRKDELGQLAGALNEMAIQIHHLIDSKQQLLHDVSHELRAPLNRLQVAAELALGSCDDKQLKYKDRIHREVDNLENLIDELLMLARIEKDPSQVSNSDITPVLIQAIDNLEFSYPNRKVDYQRREKALALFENKLLSRTLENLLTNAAKYTPEDTPIKLSVYENKKTLLIEIRDYGPGVDEKKLKNLFDPFVRLSSDQKGYGLGLAIAKRATEVQHGSLKAYNHPQGGLVFQITLPKA